MGLFDRFKKGDDAITLVSPLTGEAQDITTVPDDVFAQKMVGDGMAVKPTDGSVVAPANGTISKIFETNHAFSMETDDGVELFVHFGVDTVKLGGDGFERLIEEGAKVTAGTPVLRVDIDAVKDKVPSIMTPLVISNLDDFASFTPVTSGTVEAGSTTVITLTKK
jgi:glucose-specific phosphotransferase system IIA component